MVLDTTPPKVFLAGQPSRLVLFDGAPTFATVPATNVQHAINTNWPLLRASDAAGYYPGEYVPSHHVPSQPVSYGLDQEYAARQRSMQMNERYASWATATSAATAAAATPA